MRRFYSLSAVLMLAIIALAACNSKDKSGGAGSAGGATVVKNAASPQSTPNVPNDGVRRITTVELRDMVDKGTAVVIDTRDAASYKANHIKGSINIPVNDVASRIGELPRDKMIAAYCS
ncbi:MAG TPA: rhodanese-like domain-containing protein [Pyrinomonadaceae bacterium]|nr:rhodanese-like domain-containing protein [Pyrinomonadaceae bacterium]